MLRIAKIDNYDMLNNPGDDGPCITIWFQGCSGTCVGCHNPELHDFTKGREFDHNSLVKEIEEISSKVDTKSIILLGGEPLDQDWSSLLLLCIKLHSKGYKIWLYTRYEFNRISTLLSTLLLSRLYTVKCGPYIEEFKTNGIPASSNQYFMRNGNDGGWHKINI